MFDLSADLKTKQNKNQEKKQPAVWIAASRDEIGIYKCHRHSQVGCNQLAQQF